MTGSRAATEPDDVQEVDRLRSEVERLREQLDEAEHGHGAGPGAAPTAPAPRSGWWRVVVVTVLLVLVGLLAPAAVVATWAHDEIGDTDRYVQTVAPLASDPAVQRAVADRVTTEIFNRLDVKAVTQQAVAALQARGLPPNASAALSALATPLADGVQSYVHKQVLALVQSDAFKQAWQDANRTAHEQMVGVLTGKTGNAITVKGNEVSVNLATIINTVKTRLEDRGFALASKIPDVNAQFTIFKSADITKAQQGFRLLNAAARTLPFLALILFAVAVFVARSRRRTIVIGALVVAVSMLLLGLALNAFRSVYLGAVPTDQIPPDAAASIYDQLAHFIRLALRAVLVLFLAVAAIAWVGGESSAAVAVRRGFGHGLDAVRHRSDAAGLRTGGLGTTLWQWRTPIRAVVLGGALLVYVMAAHPTGAFAIVVLLVAGLVLLVAELLARPPAAAEAVTEVPTQRAASVEAEPGAHQAGEQPDQQPR